MKTSGIYQILNTKNGHIYLGSAVDIERRWKEHLGYLRKGKHHSAYLQRAWNVYGSGCFEFSIIETCTDVELIKREQYYIDTLIPQYNICRIAGSLLGTRRSDETKQKIRDAKVGKPSWNKGKHLSDKHKLNLGNSLKGRVIWNKGKKDIYSVETITKMRESRVGKAHSLEHKQKISESMKQQWKNKKEENVL